MGFFSNNRCELDDIRANVRKEAKRRNADLKAAGQGSKQYTAADEAKEVNRRMRGKGQW